MTAGERGGDKQPFRMHQNVSLGQMDKKVARKRTSGRTKRYYSSNGYKGWQDMLTLKIQQPLQSVRTASTTGESTLFKFSGTRKKRVGSRVVHHQQSWRFHDPIKGFSGNSSPFLPHILLPPSLLQHFSREMSENRLSPKCNLISTLGGGGPGIQAAFVILTKWI